MRIRRHEGRYAIARLAADAEIPQWVGGRFCSVTRTADELSIVAAETSVPEEIRVERGWSLLMVEGPLKFSEVGVLASLTTSLAAAGISLFAISTYDTDYVMVQAEALRHAVEVLENAGHQILAE